MIKYEYEFFSDNEEKSATIEEWLNSLGAEGWLLVHFSRYEPRSGYFVRQLKE